MILVGVRLTRSLGMAEEAMATLERRLATGHLVRVMRLAGRVDPGSIARAMNLVLARHPLLRASIVRSSATDSRFVIDESPPREVEFVAHVSDRWWQDVVEQELSSPLPDAGPLVRLTVMWPEGPSTVTDVVISCHHAVADGQALNVLCHDLIAFVDGVLNGEIGPVTELRLLPSVEDLLPSQVRQSALETLGSFMERQLQLKLDHAPVGLRSDAEPGTAVSSGLVHRELPLDASAFRDVCREKGTSVHGAVSAAVLLAAQPRLSETTDPAMALVSSMSLRELLTDADCSASIGLFSSGTRTFHQVRTSGFWSLARDAKTQVDGARARIEPIHALFLQREAIDHQIQAGGELSVAWISNLGRVDASKSPRSTRVLALHGGVPIHGAGPTLYCHVSTLGRRLFWNFVFPRNHFRRITVEQFADDALGFVVGGIEAR